MITPTIERALIAGKAILKTHTHAFGQVSKIPVPDNCFVIITDIKVSPFSQPPNLRIGFDIKAIDLDNYATHVVELSNQVSGRTGFIYRNNFQILTDPTGQQYVVNSEPITFDTYLVRNKDIYVQVGTIPGIALSSGVDTGAMAQTQCPTGAQGYGHLPVIRCILHPPASGSTEGYCPPGFPDSGQNPSPLAPRYSEALPDYNDVFCQLGTANISPFSNCMPLIQIQYVQINEQTRKDFQ